MEPAPFDDLVDRATRGDAPALEDFTAGQPIPDAEKTYVLLALLVATINTDFSAKAARPAAPRRRCS